HGGHPRLLLVPAGTLGPDALAHPAPPKVLDEGPLQEQDQPQGEPRPHQAPQLRTHGGPPPPLGATGPPARGTGRGTLSPAAYPPPGPGAPKPAPPSPIPASRG